MNGFAIKLKELGYSNRKILKMDEIKNLAFFKENDIDRNGIFSFRSFNLETQEEEEIALQSQSFT